MKTVKKVLKTIILAGGKSSRMGEDKALILIQGVPLLARIATIGQQCTSEVYIITPWIDRYQSFIPPECHLIREETPGQGPLVGFFQALNYIKTDWILLLACDLPNLTKIEVQRWLDGLENVPEDAIAFLPKNSHGWEPLCGFYRYRCLNSLDKFIQAGGRSFQKWLKEHPIEKLIVSDPQILLNCNTPDDLLTINY
ncbi:molybdopterin-guanine dinucleotide biosynthesis protein A [Rippkaea orientalis PCC 8801]|uniref:Probable molybdenum cofactor guanylyltransferase n=1 Tax=Rippkaea orientalis (strain PCC 8801 / RF-1) TaxID=41431 RepID=B7K1Y1_RIPO1|nr:molybdenum cofactor guanylyltransferase [Rippkaea orientalis]ACK64288.1 molybdopterin-guanine dinucleotide biosynthesis protein A [Rippkaea orientalis PCC 8801]